MKLARFDDVKPIEPVKKGFRGGDIRFRDLLQGAEGTRDNYGLQWVEVDNEYNAPRHRHNFEQIRIMMEGSFGFDRDLEQHAGSVGYFCEGCYYTQNAKGRSVTLLLQVGGPSGSGFMSRRQLREGIGQLAGKGQFNDGVYTWYDEQGKKHNKDSYEAVWESVHGRRVAYPKPQFDGPVLWRPERFDWRPLTGNAGVAVRKMARFHQQGLEVAQLRVDAQARYDVGGDGQTWLLFCLQGQGLANGQAYQRWTSMECGANERVTLQAEQGSEFYLIGLPVFETALEPAHV